MNSLSTKMLRRLALCVGLLAATAAQATWTFTNTTGPFGDSSSPTTDGTVSVSGFKAANNSSGCASGSTTCGFASAAQWTSNSLLSFSGGLGMDSDGNTDPNHSIDNAGTNTEGVLLSFSKSVILSSIGIGYLSGDSDISLFRYTGSAVPPSLAGTGASLTSMQTAGWELVGNYYDLAVDTTNPYNLVNPGNKGSSWWLITAYNQAYGGGFTQGNDYFKLFAVNGTKCYDFQSGGCGPGTGSGIPEPGSLALASLALVGGGIGVRRRRRAEVVA